MLMKDYNAAAFDYTDGNALPIAHRFGISDDIDENSLEGLQRAYDLGFRFMETDVHASDDNETLWAVHDPDLLATAGVDRLVAGMSREELTATKLNKGGTIPSLAQIMSDFPDVFFTIDPKEDRNVGPLLDFLERNPDYIGRVCIGSFSDAHLVEARQRLGRQGLVTSAGPDELGRYLFDSVRLDRSQVQPPDFDRIQTRERVERLASIEARVNGLPLSLQWLGRGVANMIGRTKIVNQRLLDRARIDGIPVEVWTIDDLADMERFIDMGVDGIQTNELVRIKALMSDRGIWPDTV